MTIPKSLKVGGCIGICAPSAGILKPEKQLKLDMAIKNLNTKGFRVIETESVRKDEMGRSASKQIRAKEFMELYLNPEINAIIFAGGGDFLLEMIDFVDFEKIKNAPAKWLVGYSDITGISFLVTTICEVETLYSQSIKDYAMKPLHRSLEDALKIMMGEYPIQKAFEFCEKVIPFEEQIEREPDAPYMLTEKVEWKNLYDEDCIEIEGIALGGCLDILKNIFATKYDKIKEYIKNKKIVWFFDIFESNTPEILRTMLQMKNAGYFDTTVGILVGRPLFLREDYEMDIKEALKQGLDGLNIPVIYDMDIGHVAPQMPIINGGKIKVKSKKGKGYLESKGE